MTFGVAFCFTSHFQASHPYKALRGGMPRDYEPTVKPPETPSKVR